MTTHEMQTRLRDRVGNDEAFRGRLLADPKAAIGDELGVEIPEGFTIHVHEESASEAHLVIPAPAAALSDEELKMASGGEDLWTPWRGPK